jgi:uncharacterized membrane-anchored protein
MHAHVAPIARILPILFITVLAGSAGAGEAEHQFSPQTGSVTVGANLATIAVPEGMQFLPPADARYLLEQVWKNPPDPSVIGMIHKEADSEDGAATIVVVSYSEDGHVSDDDAKKIDYDDLMQEMQEASRAANDEMVKQGYRSEELLGWAEPPHYDSDSKKLYWAKNLRFGGSPDPSLNYCIRILGRKGVLELNALGKTADIAAIGPAAQDVMRQTEFTSGNRYSDYEEGTDLKAVGGIAALVTGGLVLKKLGFLAIVGLGFLKFFKFLILPLIFLGSWLVKLFKRRRDAKADAELAEMEQRRQEANPPPAIPPAG